MKYSKAGRKIVVTAVVALLALSITATVQAQSIGLRAHIPFEFYVGNKLLPAGTYTVSSNGISGAISLNDKDGHSAGVLTNAVTRAHVGASAQSALTFNVYGDRYFLSEVRWQGYPTARGLSKSKKELEIAKMMPSGKEAQIEAVAKK